MIKRIFAGIATALAMLVMTGLLSSPIWFGIWLCEYEGDLGHGGRIWCGEICLNAWGEDEQGRQAKRIRISTGGSQPAQLKNKGEEPIVVEHTAIMDKAPENRHVHVYSLAPGGRQEVPLYGRDFTNFFVVTTKEEKD